MVELNLLIVLAGTAVEITGCSLMGISVFVSVGISVVVAVITTECFSIGARVMVPTIGTIVIGAWITRIVGFFNRCGNYGSENRDISNRHGNSNFQFCNPADRRGNYEFESCDPADRR